MKRTLVALLVVLMLCSGIVGCAKKNVAEATETKTTTNTDQADETDEVGEAYDPFGAYEETVIVTVGRSINASESLPEGDTISDNQYTRHIKENLNIEFESMWEVASGNDSDQKVNIAISSNTLPDMLTVNDVQLQAMIKAGQLADLSEVYENYASSVMKEIYGSRPKAIENITIDGEMLALPNTTSLADQFPIVWVRKDWLDELGLDEPKSIDDIKVIAEAFIEQDPGENGEGKTIGITGPSNGGSLYCTFLAAVNNMHGFDPIFSAMDSYPGFWVKDTNDELVYGSITPETREALEELAQMYAEGLLDPQMGIRNDSNEAIVSGQAGIFCGVWWNGYWPFPDGWANDSTMNWKAYMLENDEGVINNHMGAASNSYTVIRKGYEHPETAILLNNLILRDEASFDHSKGSVGLFPGRQPLSTADEVSFTIESMYAALNGEKTADDFKGEEYAVYKLLVQDVEAVTKLKNTPFDDLDMHTWNMDADINFPRVWSIMVGTDPYYGPDAPGINKVYSEIYSMTPTMELKWSTLKKMEDEVFLKIIMGVEPIESFDTFVDDWKAQGGDEITNEVKDYMN